MSRESPVVYGGEVHNSLDGDGRSVQRKVAMSLILEIRAAEGGQDAKSIVREQFAIYARLAVRERL